MVDVPNKRVIAAIEKRLRRELTIVAAARGRIRQLLTDMEEYEEAWGDAEDSLRMAADRISELL